MRNIVLLVTAAVFLVAVGLASAHGRVASDSVPGNAIVDGVKHGHIMPVPGESQIWFTAAQINEAERANVDGILPGADYCSDGPCGNVPAGGLCSRYEAGQVRPCVVGCRLRQCVCIEDYQSGVWRWVPWGYG